MENSSVQSKKIKIKIKRFDTSLPLPEYKSNGAAAMDLVARIDVTIDSHQVGMVPLNVALQLPADHWVMLSARSSLFEWDWCRRSRLLRQ